MANRIRCGVVLAPTALPTTVACSARIVSLTISKPMKIRQFVSFLIVVLLGALLTGCGSEKGKTGEVNRQLGGDGKDTVRTVDPRNQNRQGEGPTAASAN